MSGFATKTIGISMSLATGASSRSGSKPLAPGRLGEMTSAPVAPTASVSPSGGALASPTQPSVPPAPALFSIVTGRPGRSPRSWPIRRAMPSADAPGAKGTMISIGFCEVCAAAGPPRASKARISAVRRMAVSPVQESIGRETERARQRREPGVEDFGRLARGFEVEQGAVDQLHQAGLVLLPPEAGSARQDVIFQQHEILRRSAALRETQQQQLVGQEAVDPPLLQRAERRLIVVLEHDPQRWNGGLE